MKYNDKKVKGATELQKITYKAHYGIDLDKKKSDKKYELSQAVNAADLLKTEEMLKLVAEFNDDYNENHEPGFDEVKLYQALLEDEIVQLTEELELREKELNLETAVMNYRYKDPEEIPSTKTVLKKVLEK